MVKYKHKESVKAAWNIVTDRSKKFRKDFTSNVIGVLGGILILIFVVTAGSILWIADKFSTKKGKDTFLHR